MEKDINTENAILRAAEEIFFDKGYAGAKTTDIAKKAGVNHAMLHYYYRTKEKLFLIVFKRNVELLANSVFSVIGKTGDFKEVISEAISNHFDFVRKNPKLVLFIINEVNSSQNSERIWQEVSQPIFSNVVKAVVDRINIEKEAGNIGDIDPLNFVFTAISLNLFVFMARPLLSNFTGQEFEVFLNARKEENIRLALLALQP